MELVLGETKKSESVFDTPFNDTTWGTNSVLGKLIRGKSNSVFDPPFVRIVKLMFVSKEASFAGSGSKPVSKRAFNQCGTSNEPILVARVASARSAIVLVPAQKAWGDSDQPIGRTRGNPINFLSPFLERKRTPIHYNWFTPYKKFSTYAQMHCTSTVHAPYLHPTYTIQRTIQAPYKLQAPYYRVQFWASVIFKKCSAFFENVCT